MFNQLTSFGVEIGAMYKSKPTSNKNLELFIQKLEKDLINPKNVKKCRHNITKEEQIALNEIKNWDEQTTRIQDKGSRFVILDNSDYEEKVQHQINRTLFKKLSENPSNVYEKRVTTGQKNGTAIKASAKNGINLQR